MLALFSKFALPLFTLVNVAICASIWFINMDGDFNSHDAQLTFKLLLLLSGVGVTVSLALLVRTSQMKVKIAERMHIDPLTELFDRVIFNKTIEHKLVEIVGKSQLLGTAIMDLNKFKQINDTLGHPVGDKVLRISAERLRLVCGEHTVCRLGGDEFGVVLDIRHQKEAIALCNRIIDAFSDPIILDGQKIDLGISIGVAFYPAHASNSVDLIRFADIAMYESKRKKVGYTFYTKAIDTTTLESLDMVGALKFGIANGQLLLEYQLKKSLKTGEYCGAEALVRWIHPILGRLGPDSFIGIAEESALINELTNWVLNKVIDDFCGLLDQGILLSTVSVNASPYCVSSGEMLVSVTTGLARSRMTAKNLVFEVTETSIQHKPETMIKILVCLDMLGITLSIDDFGTGQSSLMYLRHLPIKEIKIDKSFVIPMLDSPQDLKIVQSTIDLAHSVNCLVVAEGVETKEVEDRLRSMGCDISQGYYVSKPIGIQELAERLKAKAATIALEHDTDYSTTGKTL